MATVVTDNKHYSDIADAIREKTGSAITYAPSAMANAIANIITGGGDTLKQKFDANGNADRVFAYINSYANSLATDFDFLNYDTTENVTRLYGAFADQSLITSIPLIDTRKVTTFQSCFAGCSSLVTLPSLNLGSATDGNSCYRIVSGCTSLTYCTFENIKADLDFRDTNISGGSVHTMIDNLVDVGQGRMLYVPSSVILTSADIAIATNKGWSIVQ